MNKLVEILNSIPVKLMALIKNIKIKAPKTSSATPTAISQPAPVAAPVPPKEVVPSVVPVAQSPQPEILHSVSTPSIQTKKGINIKKWVFVLIAVLSVVLILLIVISVVLGRDPKEFITLPTPTPASTPFATSKPLSKYATDSAVLKIKQDIDNLDRDLSTVDLDESNLKPRTLDFEISF